MSRRWVVSVLVIACAVLLTASPGDTQEQWGFTLTAGQAVDAGGYTVHFLGVIRNYPTYDVYVGTARVARFPSNPRPPNANEYVYGNLSLRTTAVSADRSVVSGTITVK